MLTFVQFVEMQLSDSHHPDLRESTYFGGNRDATLINLLYRYLSYCAVLPRKSDLVNQDPGDVLVPLHVLLEQMRIAGEYHFHYLKNSITIADPEKKIAPVDLTGGGTHTFFDQNAIVTPCYPANEKAIAAVKNVMGQDAFEHSILGKTTSDAAFGSILILGAIGWGGYVVTLCMLAEKNNFHAAGGMYGPMIYGGALLAMFAICWGIHYYLHNYKAPQRTADVADGHDLSDKALFDKKEAALRNSVKESKKELLTAGNESEYQTITSLVQCNVLDTHYRGIYTGYEAYKAGKGLLQTKENGSTIAKPFDPIVNINDLAVSLKNNRNYKTPTVKV